jgi:hypothetical protein
MMHAFAVFAELVSWNFVNLHVLGIRVAMSTCRSDVHGINFRPRIAGYVDVVHAVAVNANSNLGVSGGEFLSMHAGFVLAELVRAKSGIELTHVGGIGVAMAAKLWNLLAIDFAFPTGSLTHRDFWVVAGGVATMTTGAS